MVVMHNNPNKTLPTLTTKMTNQKKHWLLSNVSNVITRNIPIWITPYI